MIKNLAVAFCATLTLILSLQINVSNASHVSGGDIAYQCLGNDSFLITLNLYRDCSGIAMNTSETVTINSSCGTVTVSLTGMNTITGDDGTEISQLCPQDSINSACNGGPLPGMQHFLYQGIAVLPPCNDWVMSWSTCCRNNTINVPSSSGDDSYFFATMDNATDSCNNSPVFTAQPIPYVCINQTVVYNWGISEFDGDSLYFTFAPGFINAGTPLTYVLPYSANNPIDGIVMDSLTGQITFTPNTLGNFIVSVLVEEYDENGNLIGTVMRDIQFVVQNCSNTLPEDSAGFITNLTGSAIQINDFSLELCEGNSFTFEASFSDPDSTDSLTLFSNINTVLQGASFTYTGSNPVVATINWTASPGTAGSNAAFTITVDDGACPIPGRQTFVYDIGIIQATYAGLDRVICGPSTLVPGQAPLTVMGGTQFTWTAISGDSIIVGTNFSCDTCASSIATPSVTTEYEVTSDLSGSCKNIDTVMVSVVPDFSYSPVTQTDTAICLTEQVTFGLNPNPPGNFAFQWFPAAMMDDDTVQNPTATFNTSGLNTVYFRITSDSGCMKSDTFMVNVSTQIAPNIGVTGDTSICQGNVGQLSVDFGNMTPASCGLSQVPCTSNISEFQVGTGASLNTTTSYPAPYGNWYWGSRHQILYRASDLNALGFDGGQITQLAFEVAQINGTTAYNGWTISMKCTSDSVINTWQTGLSTVYNPQNITVATGWNTYVFDNSYDWDGVSNLIIEVCFNNTSFTNNCASYYTTTPYNSVVYFRADQSGVCGNNLITGISGDRPNIKLGGCDGVDVSVYNILWSPGIWLDDSTSANPTVSAISDTSYTVIVVDTVGGCSDTASVSVNIVPDFPYSISQEDTLVCMGESTMLTVHPDIPGTYFYYWEANGNTYSNDSIASPVVTMTQPGINVFYFEVWSAAGCTKRDSFVVEVMGVQPDIVVTGDTTICAGDNSQLLALQSSGSSCTYYLDMFDSFGDGWNGAFLDVFINGAFAYTYTFTTGTFASDSFTVQYGDLMEFYMTSGGFANEESYVFTDPDGDTLFADGPFPLNGLVFSGNSDCSSTVPSHVYNWSPIIDINDSEIFNPIATPNDTVTYTVVVMDTLGFCSDTASITIYPVTSFALTVSQSDTIFCSGDSALFQAVPDDTTLTYSYLWSPSATLNSDTIQSPMAGPTGSGTYSYTVMTESSEGCSRTDTVSVIVSGDVPDITFFGTAGICAGDTTNITAVNGGFNPYITYSWFPLSNLDDPTNISVNVWPDVDTTYVVIVVDTLGGCSDTASIFIDVTPLPVPEVSDSITSLCANEGVVQLSALPTGGLWSTPASAIGLFDPGSTGVGTFNIVYTLDVNGCVGDDTLLLTVNPVPLSPADVNTSGCENSELDEITVVPSDPANFVTWFDSNALTNQIASGESMNNYEIDGNDTMYVTETNSFGCTGAAAIVTVMSYSLPQVEMDADPKSGYLTQEGFLVEFANESIDTNFTMNFDWDFGDGSTSSSNEPNHNYLESGIYTASLMGTDEYDCVSMDSITITIDEIALLEVFNVFTPNSDGVNDKFVVKALGLNELNVTIFNRWGSKVHEFSTSTFSGMEVEVWDGSNEKTGTYYYVFTALDFEGNEFTANGMEGYVTLIRE